MGTNLDFARGEHWIEHRAEQPVAALSTERRPKRSIAKIRRRDRAQYIEFSFDLLAARKATGACMDFGDGSRVMFAALLAIASCKRIPEESPPATSTLASTSDATTAQAPYDPERTITTESKVVRAPSRCILQTAVDPPPAAKRAETCPRDPSRAQPTRMPIIAMTVGNTPLEVELARTDAETERGLMYRTTMAENQGMLFRLNERREHQFWMRNTCISLDMLFIDDDGLVVGIVENVPTLNDEARTVGCPSSWVLEVNAGWSRRHNVRAGQTIRLPDAARN